MSITEIIKAVIEIGITPVLLIVFVKYFLDRDKQRDQRIDEQQKQFLERENILITENAKCEQILREESAKREKILKQESEKREAFLLNTIEKFTQTMKEISEAMNDIKNTTARMQREMESISDALEQMRSVGNGQT